MKNLLKIIGTLGMSATIVAGSTSVISCSIVKHILSKVLGEFGINLDTILGEFGIIHEEIEDVEAFLHKIKNVFDTFRESSGLGIKEAFSKIINNTGKKFDFNQVTYKPVFEHGTLPSLIHPSTWPKKEELTHPVKYVKSLIKKLGLQVTAKEDSELYKNDPKDGNNGYFWGYTNNTK